MLRAFAAAALFALASGGTASATALGVGNTVTTSGGYTWNIVQCTGYACTSSIGQFTALTGQEGISITGAAGGPIETISSAGSVDTFLEFAVTSPIKNTSALGFSMAVCGGNTGASGCSGTTFNDQATTAVTSYNSASLSAGSQLAQTNMNSWSLPATASTLAATQYFASQSTVWVTFDLKAISNGGLAGIYSVSVSVPEPASGAVFALGLAGIAALRRRRR
jgi:hypothetical protein